MGVVYPKPLANQLFYLIKACEGHLGFLIQIAVDCYFGFLDSLLYLLNIAATARDGEQQDIDRQDEKQHWERGEVASALAVEHFDHHGAGSCEQVLEGEPDTAVFAGEGSNEVLKNEAHGETSRVGTLSALRAKMSFELSAAVEALCGFAFELGLGLCYGLYFVFHGSRVLTGQR